MDSQPRESDIAITGMSLRVPGARTLDQFWRNVRDGVVSLQELTPEQMLAAGVEPAALRQPGYVPWGGPIEDVESFDAAFFGIGQRDAAIMDPQHRHFLECAWEALEHAGHRPDRFDGAVGVYAGSSMNTYLLENILSNRDVVDSMGMFLVRHTANDKDFLATGVSYRLDLTGPSINVQTGQSTSLVAVHLACRGLLDGECDMAIAGGVTIQVPHSAGYLYREGEILSPDGRCRPFDAAAAGTVFSSGVGVVVLRRLADALADGDRIHAVIKATAINNDGAGKASYLAPSPEGHAAVVRDALRAAGVEAGSIRYFEAHGTGTALGDPTEVAAVSAAYRQSTDRRAFCRLGSTKANVGHMDAAAGVVSLIKTAQALEQRTLPPLANFQTPNPALHLEETPFYASSEAAPWVAESSPRRAAVSALGIGGTNAHVILEEAPPQPPAACERQAQLLVLSARTEQAADTAVANLARHLAATPELDLADVAFTLQQGRAQLPHRRAVAVRDVAEAVEVLQSRDAKRLRIGQADARDARVAFMFPGMGSQYPNMGRDLYETEPVFRAEIDRCLAALAGWLDVDLASVLYPAQGEEEWAAEVLRRPSYLSPAIFATEYAMARLLASWGIEPAAMTGHSLGEYTAACLAGVFSPEDAVRIVTERGKIMEEAEAGASLSVQLSEQELGEFINGDISLAAVNSPSLSVVSGSEAAIGLLETRLAGRNAAGRRLRLAAATHSHLLDPLLDKFRDRLAAFQLQRPCRPYISNLTGTWVEPEQAQSVDYWVRHLRHTVRFADGLTELIKDETTVLLEVGPGTGLATLARQQAVQPRAAISTIRAPNDQTSRDDVYLQDALGRLWLAGVDLDWTALHQRGRRRVPLPTYPFERRRHWIERGRHAFAPAAPSRLPEMRDWFYQPVWKRVDHAAPPDAEPLQWLILLDEGGFGEAFAAGLRSLGHQVVCARPGASFVKDWEKRTYTFRPDQPDDFEVLAVDLQGDGRLPQRIVNLLPLDDLGAAPAARLTAAVERCFDLQQRLVHALAETGIEAIHLAAVSSGMQQVSSEPITAPEKALLLGSLRALTARLPGSTAQSIDFRPGDLRDDRSWAVESLIDELSRTPGDAVVACRKPGRWLQSYEAAAMPSPAGSPAVLRQHGVYLITGGLSDAGMVLARHLAQSVQANVVFVGPAGLPPRSEWTVWLAQHGPDDSAVRTIRRLLEVEALGGRVSIAESSLGDERGLRRAIDAVESQFGRIDGAFHLSAFAPTGSAGDLSSVGLAASLSQTAVLVRALRKAQPAFLACFCSGSAAHVASGGAEAAAAAAFLDALATAQPSASGRPRLLSIAWGPWSHSALHELAGQDAPAVASSSRLSALADSEGFRPDEAMDALDFALAACRLPSIVVSTLDPRLLQRYDTPERVTDGPAGQASDVETSADAPAPKPPRDAVEASLLSHFESLLGVTGAGIDEDFFDLGGHSLLALRLLNLIKADFGVELPLASMFDASSVESLAAIVRHQTGREEPGAAPVPTEASVTPPPQPDAAWACLVPIQPEGTRPPFFCVHGMSGNVLNFRDLARNLGPDQPFYGLQAFGLNGRDRPHSTIEEMASHYIGEIQRVSPDGPYYLGGFSGGGTIAFEMARQLTAQGKHVELVAFLDTWSPRYVYKGHLRRAIGALRGAIRGGIPFLRKWTYRKSRRTYYGVRRFLYEHGIIRRDLYRLVQQRRLEESQERTVNVDMGASFIAAERKYRLRPMPQRTVMLRALWRGEDGFVPRDFGWTPYVGSLTIFDVPGGHEEMFYEPYVRIMARRLRAEMDRCMSQRGPS